ncbi:MAG: hypothetical protein M9949_04750 [Candidatus Kapabacteria bacterium]|nr:hypothetical protein [Candidatus Kapabacteria bacterium]
MSTDKTKQIFLELFPKNALNVAVTCRKTGISRGAYYKWLKDDKDFAEKIDEVTESLKDFAESTIIKLFTGVKTKQTKTREVITHQGKKVKLLEVTEIEHKPDLKALLEWLKAKAKDRGWGGVMVDDNLRGQLTEAELEEMMKLNVNELMALAKIMEKVNVAS